MSIVRTARQIAKQLGVSTNTIYSPLGRPEFNKFRVLTKLETTSNSKRILPAYECSGDFWEALCGYFILRGNWKATHIVYAKYLPDDRKICKVSYSAPDCFVVKVPENMLALDDWGKTKLAELASSELRTAIDEVVEKKRRK